MPDGNRFFSTAKKLIRLFVSYIIKIMLTSKLTTQSIFLIEFDLAQTNGTLAISIDVEADLLRKTRRSKESFRLCYFTYKIHQSNKRRLPKITVRL